MLYSLRYNVTKYATIPTTKTPQYGNTKEFTFCLYFILPFDKIVADKIISPYIFHEFKLQVNNLQ